MVRRYDEWTIEYLVDIIIYAILNKFDFFMVIEGKTGTGKSTLAYRISKGISNKMNKHRLDIGFKERDYKFMPQKDLHYCREDLMKFYDKWHRIGVADEMIQAGFLREFWNQDQNDLIKMMNMNRDHRNILIACIPRFHDLDNKLKNLCKMRISILRRGIGIVQTPNKSIYCSDIWDTKLNEKIEREWITKGVKNPKYSKLTTYRGFIRFKKLSDHEEQRYQKIKNEKRTQIVRGYEKVEDENTPFEMMYQRLINMQIKNQGFLEGVALSMNIKISTLLEKLKRKLTDDGRDTKISNYYWESSKIDADRKRLKGLLDSLD